MDIHISLAAEKIGEFFGIPLTNTLLMAWVVMAFLLVTGFLVGRKVSLTPLQVDLTQYKQLDGVKDWLVV